MRSLCDVCDFRGSESSSSRRWRGSRRMEIYADCVFGTPEEPEPNVVVSSQRDGSLPGLAYGLIVWRRCDAMPAAEDANNHLRQPAGEAQTIVPGRDASDLRQAANQFAASLREGPAPSPGAALAVAVWPPLLGRLTERTPRPDPAPSSIRSGCTRPSSRRPSLVVCGPIPVATRWRQTRFLNC
jgi:hypothetical protein